MRRGFIKADTLEQGYEASEATSFLGCQVSNVSRALQKWGKPKFEQESKVCLLMGDTRYDTTIDIVVPSSAMRVTHDHTAQS